MGDCKNQISSYKWMKTGIRDHVNSNTTFQYVKQVRQLYPKGQEKVELGSSSCSSSSISDFLMIRNEKTLINRMTKEATLSGFKYDSV